jgi:putative ABC transport system substrate-binding protein
VTGRRGALVLLGTLPGLVREAAGQPALRSPTVAILTPANAEVLTRPASAVASFVKGMRELGHVDGSTLRYAMRFADQALDRLPALAAELVALAPAVIYTHTDAGATAVAAATTTIPIVVGPAGERTMSELAGSLARPKGNVTGTTLVHAQWDLKCIEMLKEIAPRTRRVAVIFNAGNPRRAEYLREMDAGFAPLRLTMIPVPARGAADVPAAFAAIAAGRADAIFLTDDSVLAGTPSVRQRFVDEAARRALPFASSHGPAAAGGALLSLGTDIGALARRAAWQAHRILNGARPGELPVERPTVFKLTLNRRTAAALGLPIPAALLLRADEVLD